MSTFRSGDVRNDRVRRGLVGICALVAAGCGGDTTAPTATPAYWQLQLNHHAVTLASVAPYDTIRLVAAPLDGNGVLLATTARPAYATSDTSITIDSTGFVRVHSTGSDAPNITVIATLQLGSGGTRVTHADTAVFTVVHFASAADVPRPDSLHLRPVSGDSARRAVIDTLAQLGTQPLDSAVVTMATGDVIPQVVVRYRSRDSLIASFARPMTVSPEAPQVNANAPGVVLLTAEATVYGKRMTDSLWYVAGYPLRVICSYGTGEFDVSGVGYGGAVLPERNTLSRGDLLVGQGGAVLWGNSIVGAPHDSLDVQFDQTTGITGPSATQFIGLFFNPIVIPAGTGGNIPAFPAARRQMKSYTNQGMKFEEVWLAFDSTSSKARVFTQAGTYQWQSLLQGIHGTVTVVSNDSLAALHGLPRLSRRLTRGAHMFRPS